MGSPVSSITEHTVVSSVEKAVNAGGPDRTAAFIDGEVKNRGGKRPRITRIERMKDHNVCLPPAMFADLCAIGDKMIKVEYPCRGFGGYGAAIREAIRLGMPLLKKELSKLEKELEA